MVKSMAEMISLVGEIENMEPKTDGQPSTETNEQEQTEEKVDEIKELPYTVYKMKKIPTMFGQIKENNVVFCLDSSGSMHCAMSAVKEHLTEALLQRAEAKPESLFNVLEFSKEVTQWSDKMVQCTPQTVAVAADWINKVESKTSTNTMDALMTAFSDPDCEAVTLVTDGFPDQSPTDILDSVAYVSQNRPVHCFLINQGNSDPAASDFLRDLAMETYGSFHVIYVTLHGAIEQVTPIYRAEMSAERVIRSTEGNIYPSNHKVCSVGTTVNTPVVVEQPAVVAYTHPFYPYHYWPYMNSIHYYRSPEVGWSRYRAARSMLNHPTNPYDDYVPGAGSMLIGTDVLARRNVDGFFYIGNVKSQILSNKFLVEIGPCKHGKYKDTTFQETFVHDIISHTDALRHSVLTGDKVLAPMEPEGERYAPGVIISGQERRIAPGGGPDEDLVVSFFNGKSATIGRDLAVWVPHELHERVTFEINLPQKVRCEFAEQDKFSYPEENLEGYPTSGAKLDPREFEVHQPGWLTNNDPVTVRQTGYITRSPYCVPLYPIYYKNLPRPSEMKEEEIDKVIPGTDMTKDALNEKVMAQLMRYKMVLEGSKKASDTKLLKRREKLEEVSLSKSGEKSVTFKDADSDLEPEIGDVDLRDSGHGSQTDAEVDPDLEIDDLEEFVDDEEATRDAAVGTDRSLFYQRRYKQVQRPPWRYWGQDSAPSLLEPMHEGPYRVGPYDLPMTPIPWMMKTRQTVDASGVTNATAVAQYADFLAKSKSGETVADALFMPKPPQTKPKKQTPGRSVSEVLHGNMSEADKLAQRRLDYRRKRAIKREHDWHQDYMEGERMKGLMIDQHRENAQQQLDRERQRAQDEVERVRLLREAKKEINEQLRARISENQEREAARDEQRIEALRRRRERMDDIRRQRQEENERVKQSRQAARRDNSQAYWDGRAQAEAERESQMAARNRQVHHAKVQREEAFQRREESAQIRKRLIAENNENKSAVFNSRIF